ncbi:NfeD family protein [Anaerocolumna sedimenticola]|uniref:NfeD family protein n=1 Tax=Anaerocolumna sedimenticola TaxID=2696063 RepID=A0A6P1TIX9_9FIRM|nr:NfeD family protein [Anaerocolumna sedimenticola]QHQ59876.1 NfeD family protein [Anaerocolumna sedimenticola]
MNSSYWLIALAVFLVIEIITLGLTTIWFAGGALIAFILSLVADSFILEFLAFIIVSFVLLFFTRPIAQRYFNKQRIKTNYESLIGRHGKVIEKIDNFNNSGQVTLNGQEWTARALNNQDIIEPGKRIIIRDIAGVKLIVEEAEDL